MNRVFISLVLIFVVVGGLAIFQATRQTAASVLLPSELLNEQSPEKLLRVRVGAKVAAEKSYTVEPVIELNFLIQDPGDEESEDNLSLVPVVYKGLKPDMFAPGRDVIIEGEFVNGTLIARQLMTQCPSKYEPPAPDKTSGKGGYE